LRCVDGTVIEITEGVNININMTLLFGSLRLKSVQMVGLGLNTVMNGLYRFKY